MTSTFELVENFQILSDNVEIGEDMLWMFRAVDDEFVEDVLKNGFMFPSSKMAYVYGCGGIGFTLYIPHAMNYAKKRNQQKFNHVFACPMPKEYNTVSMIDLPLRHIDTNLLITNMINGDTCGSEFILYGQEHTYYKPKTLLWLKYINKKQT